MKKTITIFFSLLVTITVAQDVQFSNQNLKTHLLTHNTVDTNGNEYGDEKIDLNNDGEIQVSEAELITNLVIGENNLNSIETLSDLTNFQNLKRLTIWGDLGLFEISNLGLDSLDHIRISDHTTIRRIDLSDLTNLSSIYIEGLEGVEYLNLQNGSFADSAFSLFYTYVKFACVDSISSEYSIVSDHLTNDGEISVNCSLSLEETDDSEKIIYPNPTSGKVYLGNNVSEIKLFNPIGQLLSSKKALNNELDLTNSIKGVYLLEILYFDGTTIKTKIVKN